MSEKSLIEHALASGVIDLSDKAIAYGSNQCGEYVKLSSGKIIMHGTTSSYPCQTLTAPKMFYVNECIGKLN